MTAQSLLIGLLLLGIYFPHLQHIMADSPVQPPVVFVDPVHGVDQFGLQGCTCGQPGATTACKSLLCAVVHVQTLKLTPATIQLLSGTYTGPKNSWLEITQPISIVGNATDPSQVVFTLVGERAYHPLVVYTSPAVDRSTLLAHISITGAWQSGVVIRGGASPTLNNIRVSNCKLHPAVYIEDFGSHPIIQDSSFTNNGDIVSESVITVTNGASVTMHDITMRDNSATRGVYIRTGHSIKPQQQVNVTIKYSVLIGNSNHAIDIESEYRQLYVVLDHIEIVGNGFSSVADAVRISASMTTPHVELNAVTIARNQVNYAALHVVPGVQVDLYLRNCEIVDNTGGSGIFKLGRGVLVMEDCTVSLNDNGAQLGGITDGGGGAQIAGNITMTRVTFEKNNAPVGGGLYLGPTAHRAVLTDVRFLGNEAIIAATAVYASCTESSSDCMVELNNVVLESNILRSGSARSDIHRRSMLTAQSGTLSSQYVYFLNSTNVQCSNDPTYIHCPAPSAAVAPSSALGPWSSSDRSSAASTTGSVVRMNGEDVCNQRNSECPNGTVLAITVITSMVVFVCVVFLGVTWWAHRQRAVERRKRRGSMSTAIPASGSYVPLSAKESPDHSRRRRGTTGGGGGGRAGSDSSGAVPLKSDWELNSQLSRTHLLSDDVNKIIEEAAEDSVDSDWEEEEHMLQVQRSALATGAPRGAHTEAQLVALLGDMDTSEQEDASGGGGVGGSGASGRSEELLLTPRRNNSSTELLPVELREDIL